MEEKPTGKPEDIFSFVSPTHFQHLTWLDGNSKLRNQDAQLNCHEIQYEVSKFM